MAQQRAASRPSRAQPAPTSAESQFLRGLRVLESLASEARTASELSRSMGVNRSTSLRFLNELHAAGYLRRDERTKRYMTRPERFYRFVGGHPAESDLAEVFGPVLRRLQDESGEGSVLGIPANGVMVYMAYLPSFHAVTVRERVGTTRPMHSSALGKAYLSALDADALDVELGRLSYRGGTDLAAKGPMELRTRIEAARVRGFAFDREETLPGVSCVAAPAFADGSLVGAIGVSGLSSRLSDDDLARLGAMLIADLEVDNPSGHRTSR